MLALVGAQFSAPRFSRDSGFAGGRTIRRLFVTSHRTPPRATIAWSHDLGRGMHTVAAWGTLQIQRYYHCLLGSSLVSNRCCINGFGFAGAYVLYVVWFRLIIGQFRLSCTDENKPPWGTFRAVQFPDKIILLNLETSSADAANTGSDHTEGDAR